MNYNKSYSNTYRALIEKKGSFDMGSVMFSAFMQSPEDFTKKQITELGLQVLDDALNSGMVEMVDEGVYKSILSSEKDDEIESSK